MLFWPKSSSSSSSLFYCLGDLLFFFWGRFFASVGTPSLFISVYNLTFSVEMWGENKKEKCIITRGFIIFCLSASLVVILEFL